MSMILRLSDNEANKGETLAADAGYTDAVNEWNEWSRENGEELLQDRTALKERVEELEGKNESMAEEIDDLIKENSKLEDRVAQLEEESRALA